MAGFRKATAEQAALKLGIYGPSGSGKTFTSLLIAEGLAQVTGRRVAYVDTERGTDFYCKTVPSRRVHPDAFDFDAIYTKSLTEIIGAVKSLNPKDHAVVVIDSISHLWDSARLAYEGRTTKAGTIPMHAWAQIKKPYKELVNYLLSSPLHVIFCGRQGNEYAEDEAGETKMVGVKMRAEGETPYEPHILIRMEAVRSKTGSTPTAFVEKDRTGVLAGKSFATPNFDTLCKPILPLLGETQATLQTDDEIAATDGEALSRAEQTKARQSDQLRTEWAAKIDLCRTPAELKDLGKRLTAAEKAKMLPAHVTALRDKYHQKELALANGGAVPQEQGEAA